MLGSVVLRPPRLRAEAGSGRGGVAVGLELRLCFLAGSGLLPTAPQLVRGGLWKP